MVGGLKAIIQKNGWTIGTSAEYENYDIQDNEDSENMYITLEKKIIQCIIIKMKKVFQADGWK